MARFNTQPSVRSYKDETVNHEGGQAFKLSDQAALYQLACTSMLADKYYQKEGEVLSTLRELIQKCGPAFTAHISE